MKFYDQTDFEANKREKRRQTAVTAALMFPFLLLGGVAFALRMELLCIIGCVLAGSILIFRYDLRIKPVRAYGRHLAEIHSGLTRRTLGALVRIGDSPVYQDGVNFYEVILNIYEDMSEEGERRFLLDTGKTIPAQWVGRDVTVTSHGSFLLEMEPVEEAKA